MFRKLICLLAVVHLAACADGGTTNIVNDVGLMTAPSAAQSPAQAQLASRQQAYAKSRLVATGIGAAGGIVACRVAMKRDCDLGEMLVFAGVGAVIGYSSGAYLTRANQNFQVSQDGLKADIAAARTQNEQMRLNVSAAQGALSFQRSEISRLNRALTKGEVTTAQYRASYNTMRQDLRRTTAMRTQAESDVAKLQASINTYRTGGASTGSLSAEAASQQARVKQLKDIESAMAGVLTAVPSSVRGGA